METINKITHFLTTCDIPVTKVPVLVWDKNTNDGVKKMFYNMNTVKLSDCISNVLEEGQEYIEIPKKSKDMYKYYVKYMPEFNGVLLGRAVINSKAVKEVDVSNYELVTNGRFSKEEIKNYLKNTNVIRHWKKAGEIFITADKKYIYKDYEWKFLNNHYVWTESTCYYLHDKISSCAPFHIQNIPIHECGINGENWRDLCTPMLNIFPQFCNFGVNAYGDILIDPYNLKVFLNYKEPKKTGSKLQREIDELVKIALPDIPYYERYWGKCAFVQKVKDKVCVIRTMITDFTGERMIDCARIYITDKKAIACRPRNNGEWITTTLKSGLHHWDMPIEYINKEDIKGTKLEYLFELARKFDEKHRTKFICTLLTYPVIEQLAKAGFEELVLAEVNATFWEKGIKPFEKIFGKLGNGERLLVNLGVNKYQFKRVSSYMREIYTKKMARGDVRHSYYYDLTPFGHIKDILGDNISFYDNETFDLVFNTITELDKIVISHSISYWVGSAAKALISTYKQVFQLYGLNTLKKIMPKCIEIFKKDIADVEDVDVFTWRNSGVARYNDYISIVSQLGDTAHFSADFETKEDIDTMHDLVMDVYNSKILEINEKKFAKEIKKCNKWTYTGKDFAVIAPKVAEDIAVEGIILHHCVKGYIGKVSDGETNIMFIRKSNELDKPFFTVEITNNATIQQVHGFGNRNANTEDGLLDFIKEWSEAKDLKTSNFNKIR